MLDVVLEFIAHLFLGWVPDRTWARVLVALIYLALAAFGIYLAHELLERDEQGRMRHLGYVVRFGPFVVYHSGDTVQYPGHGIGRSTLRARPATGRRVAAYQR